MFVNLNTGKMKEHFITFMIAINDSDMSNMDRRFVPFLVILCFKFFKFIHLAC